MARAFGAGMGQGDICGALTGAIMAIGLTIEKMDDERIARARSYDLVEVLVGKFKDRFGAIDCKDLLNVDLATAEGRATAGREKLFTTTCPELVAAAAEILDEILADPPESGPGSRVSEFKK